MTLEKHLENWLKDDLSPEKISDLLIKFNRAYRKDRLATIKYVAAIYRPNPEFEVVKGELVRK